MRSSTATTSAGRIAIDVDPGVVWRVGYRPDPWAWTPWRYATDGRFLGRWDDPEGRFRTVYVARTLAACLLEVLAPFRPDPMVAAGLADISEDPEDAEHHPTVAAGTVARSWLKSRTAGTGVLVGRYAAVSRAGSLATLRSRFLPLANSLGLPDLDAGTLKLVVPRELTQAIAGWLHEQYAEDRPVVDGVRFDSRHGDGQPLWAVFERPRDTDTSALLVNLEVVDLEDSGRLAAAFRLHRLRWG